MCFRFVIFLIIFLGVCEGKVDPNHLDVGGYGYLVDDSSKARVWWAEGAYKVMQDAPVPTQKREIIKLESARNEWESFILVINPKNDLSDFQIKCSDFITSGSKIPVQDILIRKVEYVEVTHPTDSYGFVGMWPDPLPLYKGGDTLAKNVNQAFWISIKTPKDSKSGLYKANLSITAKGWKQKVPVELEVWDFVLPDTPSMRSGFGLSLDNISIYNNLTTDEEKQHAFDLHMKAFSDYKVSPFYPFLLNPIKEEISGIAWEGGFFDEKDKKSGKYSYMVNDDSHSVNSEAKLRQLHKIEGGKAYQLQFWAKSNVEGQSITVGVECYDAQDNLLFFENRFEEFRATLEWTQFTLPLRKLDSKIAKIMVRLFPSKRTLDGVGTGIAWFDDIVLSRTDVEGEAKAWTQGDDSVQKADNETIATLDGNYLPSGNFEVDLDKIDIQLDFSEFKKMVKKYKEEYHFTGHNQILKGLGGGTYYSSSSGVFEGFVQGSDEYNKLMARYLKQIQDNLEGSEMLGQEYIYWFDEPNEGNYPFIAETHKMLKGHAPKLTTFLTEHIAGQDISDVTDISCTIWHKLNHEKIKKMNDKGLEHWSYLCCWPKSPWISEFIDHDVVNMRMWIWASYVHGLKGILVWEAANWHSPEASPVGKFQNPWTEAMSWVSGYGWVLGKQTIWGNGDGRMFYPENRDVNNDKNVYNNEAIPCIRLELLRDGIEDYEYLLILKSLVEKYAEPESEGYQEAKALLTIPQTIYTDEKTYNKDPQAMLKHRKKIAEAILKLQK